MSGFSRTTAPRPTGPCIACCKADQAADDRLSLAAARRLHALSTQAPAGVPAGAAAPAAAQGAPFAGSAPPCAQRARSLAPVLQRFDRYRDALPSARAAADMSALADASGDRPTTQACLTRLPVEVHALRAALGLPPTTLLPQDLRNDETGFRAAIYRDERSGRLLLVPRDTEPDSLVDWMTNTRNGIGLDTPQYRSMRSLTSALAASGTRFDLAGYSKGGGLAQEGGLIADEARVRVFNSAGLSDAALGWTRQASFDSLAARTQSFSAQGDFLTFMNTTTDPGQNILNARFLRKELAGQARGLNPIDISVRNPAMRATTDPDLPADKAAYLAELDTQIDRMQSAYDTGGSVAGFPPVRAADQEAVAGSATVVGRLLGADGAQPSLGMLNQHKMSVVLDALESDVRDDRERLRQFMRNCG